MRSRPKVLLPSDDFDWVANFVDGYRKIGFDVAAGHLNFRLESSDYDILHLLWPEEFTEWNVPTGVQIDAVLRRLDSWAKRSRIVLSVSNLYPHRYPNNPLFHRLYTGFYERSEVIHHFSEASRQLVCREYPSIAGRNHVVRLGFNYERLLYPGLQRDRTRARSTYGFAPEEVVFLVFGALRFWDEVGLLARGFARARVPNKRLLLRARYLEGGPIWRQRWRRWKWRRWRASNEVRLSEKRVPDGELPALFDAADAVLVVRQNNTVMNSGLPNLAMTLGRFVIAPKLGSTPEMFSNTGNILYDPTSANDLARAMELAAAGDRESVGAENARIAAEWSWPDIVRTCVNALPQK
jgi:glycosyltransferase involved in cell wall biosynthesis